MRTTPALLEPPGPASSEGQLGRTLGFWELLASGVGIIVGAGIYVLVGEATAQAGAAVWVSFVLAAVLSALTALSYCELASMYPRAAAEYEYTSHVFPRWLAFLVGWVMIAGLVVAAAAVSLGFARYASVFVDIDRRILSLGLIACLCALALTGVRRSSRLTILLSAIQVGGLLVVVAVGLPHTGDYDLSESRGTAGILGAAALIFFAFIGFDEVTTLSEETRRPTRTIPLALLCALGVSTVLYVAVAVTSVSVLGAEALGTSERPLTDVLATAVGGTAGRLVAVVAIVSTTNTTLLALTAGSRMAFGMARDGALPGWLAVVRGSGRSPMLAVASCSVIAGAISLMGDLRGIAATTDVAVYFVFLATNLALIVLRFQQPDAERPFRTPIAIGRLPVIPVLALAATLLMMSRLDLAPLGAMSLLAAAGLGLYGGLNLVRRFRRGAGNGRPGLGYPADRP